MLTHTHIHENHYYAVHAASIHETCFSSKVPALLRLLLLRLLLLRLLLLLPMRCSTSTHKEQASRGFSACAERDRFRALPA